MPALEESQHDFLNLVLDPQASLAFIQSPEADIRFNVYRQTIMINLVNALALTFPGIWQLLGKECAESAARAFCQNKNNLPRTGWLGQWGEQFPEFLATLSVLKHLFYLKDYAYYEWLKHTVYHAAKAQVLAPDELTQILPGVLADIRFEFIPACEIWSTSVDLKTIQTVIDDPQTDFVCLAMKPTFLMIARAATVMTYWLTEEVYSFIEALKQGLSLSQAHSVVSHQFLQFDCTQAMFFLLQAKVISKIL